MEFITSHIDALYTSTGDVKLEIAVKKQHKAYIATLMADYDKAKAKDKDKLFTVSICRYKRKRTLDANAYLWVLCDKIAKVIKGTKEEVYRKAIKDVGVFQILPIKSEAVGDWIRRWQDRGLGWIAEIMEKSKLSGYTKTINYFGSSTYTRSEMARLINYIIDEAKELDIETITPQEKQRMLNKIKEK